MVDKCLYNWVSWHRPYFIDVPHNEEIYRNYNTMRKCRKFYGKTKTVVH